MKVHKYKLGPLTKLTLNSCAEFLHTACLSDGLYVWVKCEPFPHESVARDYHVEVYATGQDFVPPGGQLQYIGTARDSEALTERHVFVREG